MEYPAQDLSERLSQPPPVPSARRPGIPSELDAVVARMLAKDPEDRYPNPQALMRALLRFLNPESSTSPMNIRRRRGESQVPITEAQRQDLQRRLAAYEANSRDGSGWEEVKARLRANP